MGIDHTDHLPEVCGVCMCVLSQQSGGYVGDTTLAFLGFVANEAFLCFLVLVNKSFLASSSCLRVCSSI